MSEDEALDSDLQKLATNLVGGAIHQEFNEDQLLELLEEAGKEWRWKVWHPIPTSMTFDVLYAASGRFSAFMYYDKLYEYEYSVESWTVWEKNEDIRNWLLENPPFTELEPISSLYQYARGHSENASPWLLLQYIVGIAVTSQGMGLNSLMGIGSEEAIYLGPALTAYGEFSEVAESYVELLIMYGGD